MAKLLVLCIENESILLRVNTLLYWQFFLSSYVYRKLSFNLRFFQGRSALLRPGPICLQFLWWLGSPDSWKRPRDCWISMNVTVCIFCWMLWRLFFWCLLKLLCSQRCWKVTRLSHLLPPSSQGKRICIYGKWNSGGKNQRSLQESVPVNKVVPGVHNTRDLSQRGVQARLELKKNLFLPIYLFVCWFRVSWVAAKCLWAKQIHVPFLSFIFFLLFLFS